jgi:glutathione S-transferase
MQNADYAPEITPFILTRVCRYKDVNPETKVPALTVDKTNIAESLVLVELIHDLFPEQK